MKTKKTTDETSSEIVGDVNVLEAVEPVVNITRFAGDFNREDLNLLVVKVNEIIDFLNK